ncbi:MAG: hypothetical protein PHC39_04675 [Proteiniphilum sp.]|nr:hypothetical protein [Proteiniphilum sp.]
MTAHPALAALARSRIPAMRVPALMQEPRVDRLAGFFPSYGYQVNGRTPTAHVCKTSSKDLDEWMIRKQQRDDEMLRGLI